MSTDARSIPRHRPPRVDRCRIRFGRLPINPADISENSTRGSSTNPVSLVQKLEPKRLVIIGDSHSAAPNSWTDSIDCVPVKNWSAAGATVDVNTAFSGLDERIKGLSAGLTPGDVVLIALGSNDVGSWSIADMKRSMSSIRNTLNARNIQLVWSTIPPLSPDYPIPTLLERAQRERTDWNDLIMSTPNAIDLSAPLGDELNPDEDSGRPQTPVSLGARGDCPDHETVGLRRGMINLPLGR